VMPASTDLYFHADDSRFEVEHLQSGTLRVLESKWGHSAGGPDRNPRDTAIIERAILELLEANVK